MQCPGQGPCLLLSDDLEILGIRGRREKVLWTKPVSQQLKAFCCTTGKPKGCWAAGSLCPTWIMCAPKLVLPLALISPSPVRMGVAGLGHLICNPLAWILHRVSPLSFFAWDWEWDCQGHATAGTLGWAPPVGAWLCWELLVGVGSWAGKLGALLHFGAAPSAKKRTRSEGRSVSSHNLFVYLKPNLLPQFFLLLWGGIASLCPVLGFLRLGL